MEQALARGPARVEMLLVGDLKYLLTQPKDQLKKDLATAIASSGLVDQKINFIERRRYRGKGGWSWRMWRDGRTITGRRE